MAIDRETKLAKDRQRQRERYARDGDRIKEGLRARNAADPEWRERKNERNRASYAANAEKRRAQERARHAANPEKRRARERARRAADPEKFRQKSREWSRARYAADPEWRRQIAANGANYWRLNFERLNQYNREYVRRKRHGLLPDGVAAMHEAQDGLCYLCGEVLAVDEAVVEHDHDCCPANASCWICQRGLAHGLCNKAIGFADDDPDKLRRMADALEAAKLKVAERRAALGEQLAFDFEKAG